LLCFLWLNEEDQPSNWFSYWSSSKSFLNALVILQLFLSVQLFKMQHFPLSSISHLLPFYWKMHFMLKMAEGWLMKLAYRYFSCSRSCCLDSIQFGSIMCCSGFLPICGPWQSRLKTIAQTNFVQRFLEEIWVGFYSWEMFWWTETIPELLLVWICFHLELPPHSDPSLV